MNCREAQSQIFAERDGALPGKERTELDGHLAQCDACQKVRADLAAALSMWKNDLVQAVVPDAEHEWHAVRRRIRSDGDAASRPRRNPFLWFALPLSAAAAAAVAFTLFVSTSAPTADSVPSPGSHHVARADSVEAPGNNASTMVFVDEKSGWLIVWASDAAPKRG